jgi:hypothetical protein
MIVHFHGNSCQVYEKIGEICRMTVDYSENTFS